MLGFAFSWSTILIVPNFLSVRIKTHIFYLKVSMEKWGNWSVSTQKLFINIIGILLIIWRWTIFWTVAVGILQYDTI